MIDATIRATLAAHARLQVDAATVDREADLFAAGLTSHASVSVMLGLEDAFDVEFPDDMLTRATFTSVGTIAAGLARLGVLDPPAS